MSLEITTSIPCFNACRLCPQDVLRRNYVGPRFLSLDDFKIALGKIPVKIKIVFSGFSEPFLNPSALDMMEHASKEGHSIHLYSTLVGLKVEDVKRLAGIPVDYFVLHLPDNLGNARIPITGEYKNVLIQVLRSMNVDAFSVMNRNFPNNGRAGNLTETKRRRGFFSCTYLERNIFVLLPSCDVVLCCMDYGLRHVLGNLLKQDYMEILGCKKYRTIKRNRHELDGNILCRRCKCAYNPLFYSLIKLDRTVKRLALGFYSRNVNVRDQLIREHDVRNKVG